MRSQEARSLFPAFRVLPIALAAITCVLLAEQSGAEEPAGGPSPDARALPSSEAFQRAAERALPAMVTIETLSGPRKTLPWALHEAAPHQAPPQPEGFSNGAGCPHCAVEHARGGTGSGIVIDRRGFVLTCQHVVAAADAVFVRLDDGRKLEAKDMWADAFTDLAVLRIASDEPLPAARLGDSDRLAVGQWVVSVGNPYDLGPSVAAGVVSATDRELPDVPWTRLIQSDAASNPGNSGGALVNLRGEVVGISEGGYSAAEGFHGIGFSIPINAAIRIARQLIENGEVRRAYLGCRTQSMTPEIAGHLELPPDRGLIVTEVTPGSPASSAGIQMGDVLTTFDGSPIRDGYHLHRLLEQAPAGKRSRIGAFRSGETISIDAHLDSRPERENSAGDQSERRPPHPARHTDEKLGLMLDELSPELAHRLGFDSRDSGVLVTGVIPGRSAYQEGICAGMLILRVGDQPTPNVERFRAAMSGKSLDDGVMMVIATPAGNRIVVLHRHDSPSQSRGNRHGLLRDPNAADS